MFIRFTKQLEKGIQDKLTKAKMQNRYHKMKPRIGNMATPEGVLNYLKELRSSCTWKAHPL